MIKIVDARGMQCPLPVIETKKVLKGLSNGIVEVLVDNEIAVQNLSKMAKQMQLKYSSEKLNEDNFTIRIELSDELREIQTQTDNTESTVESCFPDIREDNTICVLSSSHMGEGDEQLGKTLMKGFIYALTELEKLPKKIILYNGGAKLPVEGSDSLEDLKLLEAQGVEILTCGACLNFYGLTDKLSVGSVTNMYAIAEMLMDANKIIKP